MCSINFILFCLSDFRQSIYANEFVKYIGDINLFRCGFQLFIFEKFLLKFCFSTAYRLLSKIVVEKDAICLEKQIQLSFVEHINIKSKQTPFMKKIKSSSFLTNLYQLLQEPGNEGVISWNLDGNGFEVYDSNRLCQQLLPKFFKHSKLTSFIRQINMYNFHKVYKNKCQFAYSHKFFTRGNIDNFKKIKRKKQTKKVEKIFQVDDQDDECDSDQQFVILRKDQLKLEAQCLKSIERTQKQLKKAQSKFSDLLNNEQNEHQQFLCDAKLQLKNLGILDEHQQQDKNLLSFQDSATNRQLSKFYQLMGATEFEEEMSVFKNHQKYCESLEKQISSSNDLEKRQISTQASQINRSVNHFYN